MGHHDWKKDTDVVDGLTDVNARRSIGEGDAMEEGASAEPVVKTKRRKHLRKNRIGLLLLLIVLVVLGGIVAFILIAMYLPVFNIAGSTNGPE